MRDRQHPAGGRCDAIRPDTGQLVEHRVQATIRSSVTFKGVGLHSGRPVRMTLHPAAASFGIWFRRVDGRVYITGTPGPRDWYANLQANPLFTFHLKESIAADLPARARLIQDREERRRILAAPTMAWYHSQVSSVDDLVAGSPLVEVLFEEPQSSPNI